MVVIADGHMAEIAGRTIVAEAGGIFAAAVADCIGAVTGNAVAAVPDGKIATAEHIAVAVGIAGHMIVLDFGRIAADADTVVEMAARRVVPVAKRVLDLVVPLAAPCTAVAVAVDIALSVACMEAQMLQQEGQTSKHQTYHLVDQLDLAEMAAACHPPFRCFERCFLMLDYS